VLEFADHGLRNEDLSEQRRENVDFADGLSSIAGRHPRRRSLVRGVTNRSNITVEVVHRIGLEGFCSAQERLCLPSGAKAEHLLHLCRRDGPGAIRFGSDGLHNCAGGATSLGGEQLSDVVWNVDSDIHSELTSFHGSAERGFL
jgi:hypothetical protein